MKININYYIFKFDYNRCKITKKRIVINICII